MKIFISILFAIFLCSHLSGQQVIVYKTYDDYKNNTGKEYQEFTRYIFTNLSGSLVVKNGNEKSMIRWRDVWGFKINFFVYRIFEGEAYRLVVPGPKLYYYDDGKTHIAGELGNRYDISNGIPTSFLSKTLESDIITVFRTSHAYDETKQIEKLKKKLPEPEYKSFFDCLGTSVFGPVLVDCVKKNQE